MYIYERKVRKKTIQKISQQTEFCAGKTCGWQLLHFAHTESKKLKEARNSFFGLGVYLLKSKFCIEGKLRFP